eukprot:scaffold787_cov115-Isochrysis_galbana.AAC.3
MVASLPLLEMPEPPPGARSERRSTAAPPIRPPQAASTAAARASPLSTHKAEPLADTSELMAPRATAAWTTVSVGDRWRQTREPLGSRSRARHPLRRGEEQATPPSPQLAPPHPTGPPHRSAVGAPPSAAAGAARSARRLGRAGPGRAGAPTAAKVRPLWRPFGAAAHAGPPAADAECRKCSSCLGPGRAPPHTSSVEHAGIHNRLVLWTGGLPPVKSCGFFRHSGVRIGVRKPRVVGLRPLR